MAYDSKTINLPAGEALEADRLVKISAGTLVYSDAGDEPVGVNKEPVASGVNASAWPLDGSVQKLTASGVISAGSAVYAANDGKISASAVGKQLGINLEATAADGGKTPTVVWGPRGGNDFQSSHHSVIEYFDDFFTYNTTFNYAIVEDAGATEADKITDANGGVLQIGCDGDDNDECYISSIAEIFKFQTDKRLFFEAYVKLTEANTDDANIIIGLSDTVAADSLVDDGAGPMASYDGVVFFKVDGGTVWQFESSNAATQDTEMDVGDVNDGEWTKLAFFYDPNDGVTAIITPYVDGVAGTAVNLTIAGLAEMHILMGVKAGGTNEEALLVDYVHVACER